MPKVFECPGCRARVDGGELIYPVPDVQEKVLPGEPMPEGECPECGELIGEGDLVKAERGIDGDEDDAG